MTLTSSVLAGADAVAAGFGLLDRPIRTGGLINIARRRSGYSDFGDMEFAEPLDRLLRACVEEAQLSLVGRIATRWDMVRFLSNLLRLRHEEAQDPSILEEPIDRPIFITGLPRSGTTFLYKLLMLDPFNDAPRVYQTIHPYPLSGEGGGDADKRIAAVDRQLRMFDRLAPEFRGLHPLDATSPQECSEITAHIFASLRFDSTYDIPSYRAWLDDTGHLAAYQFHKRFLRHLQRQVGRRRWVVKCPDHLFALDAIRAVYPDARITFVHRDPLKVLASVARLTEIVRKPFTRSIDRARIGRQESDRWLEGAFAMVRSVQIQGFAEPIHHIWHTDLVAEPIPTIEGLYRHFGLALGESVRQAISAEIAQVPNGGYGTHRYRLQDHGLDPAEQRRRFDPYMEAFGIMPETVAHAGDASMSGMAGMEAARPLSQADGYVGRR